MRKLIATGILAATLTAAAGPVYAATGPQGTQDDNVKGAWLTSLGVDGKRFADPDVAKAAFVAVGCAALVVKAAHMVAGQVGR